MDARPFPIGTLIDRIVWAMLAGVAMAVLVTARILTPDPIHGSSLQLGIAPCGFQQFTGHQCPGCGLTTAFAYMARLDLVGAWHVNAFGILLFLVTAAFVPFALTAMWKGWNLSATLARLQAERVGIVIALLMLVHWLVRLVVTW